jgi:hypothetical protein
MLGVEKCERPMHIDNVQIGHRHLGLGKVLTDISHVYLKSELAMLLQVSCIVNHYGLCISWTHAL